MCFFLLSKTCILRILKAINLDWCELCLWKIQQNQEIRNSEPVKLSKWQIWSLKNYPKLISREIWLAGKFLKFLHCQLVTLVPNISTHHSGPSNGWFRSSLAFTRQKYVISLMSFIKSVARFLGNTGWIWKKWIMVWSSNTRTLFKTNFKAIFARND